jgi:SAM-dependent methyltransferase
MSDDPAANLATPPPAPVPDEVSAATERSGSISISGGDFATPMVRKRTITKPRGLPTVPVVDLAADIVTPPPRQNGADPAELKTLSGAAVLAPLPAIDDLDSLHGQASRLRGERPVPSVDVDLTTPPPPAVESQPVALAAPAEAADIDPGPTPAPAPAEPEPQPLQLELKVEPIAAVPAEGGLADPGAIPSRPMHEADSERNLTPLAQTLAHIAEEAQRRTDVSPAEEMASEDDLELVDAPLDAPPASPIAPPLRMLPAAALATPPPIPSILAKAASAAIPPPSPAAVEIRPPLPTLPNLPEALAERPRRPKRSRPWFEEIFDEDYLRTLPFMTPAQTMKEVSFIEASLEAPAGAEILDVGCGYGRHAVELVQKGLNVTGLDLSLPLLIKAADEAQRRSLSVNFVHADMREMPFDRKFDGAYCMLTSFGYFDEDANLRVAEGVSRALKPGGRFLLDIVNRDYVVADLPTRIWWEGVGCVVLEEVDFNFHTSRIVTRRSVVFEDGRQLEQEISVRAYSLHELGRLLRQAGFRVLDISGSLSTRGRFLGVNSRNLLVLSEKRSD